MKFGGGTFASDTFAGAGIFGPLPLPIFGDGSIRDYASFGGLSDVGDLLLSSGAARDFASAFGGSARSAGSQGGGRAQSYALGGGAIEDRRSP